MSDNILYNTEFNQDYWKAQYNTCLFELLKSPKSVAAWKSINPYFNITVLFQITKANTKQ
jgi:hypothetical protein